ncbi:hypothetical protein MNBD_GAMMA21-1927 [hydrothermal vent metagenome]|uniref:Uncharacterized protein n=1 Tax=hydrothermal vent metagenome TaxID=652676 RepID=A0A3B1A720_9ZZZZ
MKLHILKLAKYLLLTFVATLLILIVVNLKDEDFLPIPDLAEKQEPIEKSVNAYYAIVGFNAATGEDMQQTGYKVVDEFERYVIDKNDFDFKVEQVARASGLEIKGNSNELFLFELDEKYFAYLLKNKQAILDFKQKNHHLYKRYRKLITYQQFKEDSFYIPSWSGILTMHKLHLNLIGLEWLEGDKNRAVAMLSETMNFSRMLFDDSEMLISRMIATALLAIGLRHYSEISRVCKNCTSLDRIIQPMSSLSRNDICLKKSFNAELKYVKRDVIKAELYDLKYDDDVNLFYWLANKYFLQPAATFNNISDVYNKLLQTCELKTYEISTFLERNQGKIDYDFPWYSYLYNPAGKYFLENFGFSSLSSYIDTMLYLETQIRMLRLQRMIYTNNIKPDDVASYLDQQDENLKNPFTNNSFKYNKESNMLFYGNDQSKSITVPLRRNSYFTKTIL